MTTQKFGVLPTGEQASLYTISCGALTAKITDYGATLVSLLVPDRSGNIADVVLGFDDCNGYRTSTSFLGATVGRSANRIAQSTFLLNDTRIRLTPNDGPNNLHSGPDFWNKRMWQVVSHEKSAICLSLHSPRGDQGFPGNAQVQVTYRLDARGGLHIVYDALCDQDTVFNMTNHSYFNLAGHEQTSAARKQKLTIPGRFFCPDDARSIPTGELRPVDGTPFDFRVPKEIDRDIDGDYDALELQGGYDHNFEVFCNPCAYLCDEASGRTMAVYTDCPGIQLYVGNFLNDPGKEGVHYGKRSGIALETQFYPDSVNHPEWSQPFIRAGERYHSETVYRFEY